MNVKIFALAIFAPLLMSSVQAMAAGLAASPAAQAAKPPVSIQAGDYAADGYTCATAPFAGLLHYDGRNFSGPHASLCTSLTLAKSGTTYTVKTTCRAEGDGSPSKPFGWTGRYRVLTPTRVVQLGPRGRAFAQTFHRCTVPPPGGVTQP